MASSGLPLDGLLRRTLTNSSSLFVAEKENQVLIKPKCDCSALPYTATFDAKMSQRKKRKKSDIEKPEMNPGNAWSAYAATAGDSATVWPTAAPPGEGTETEQQTAEPANSSMVSQEKNHGLFLSNICLSLSASIPKNTCQSRNFDNFLQQKNLSKTISKSLCTVAY